MKKIVIATDAWFPQVNGVVRCIEELKKRLEKNNFEVTIIHPGLFYSVPLFFYSEIRIALFPRRKIERILKEKNPDYIHIVTEGPIGLSIRAACLKNKFKFTTANHTNFQVYAKYYLVKFDLFSNVVYGYLRWFHNAGSGTMVITEGLKRGLEKRGFLHVLLWPLGVDTELFKRNLNSPVQKDFNFKPPVFVYFGRIAKEKNVEEYLKLNLPGTKLVIGDGPLKKRLENRYGKKAVFLGCKTGKELVDFLSACDVFVFPSLTDTFPLAIIEAFSCGIPVAAHNVMDLKDLVLGDVGFLDENLEEAAVSCLNISRERCREYALKFSWEESAKHFIQNLVELNRL
jgi:glycosyltransferase involved in cell wall biosynthesis